MKKSKIFIFRKTPLEWSERSEIGLETSPGSQGVPTDHLRPPGKISEFILKIDFPTSKSIFFELGHSQSCKMHEKSRFSALRCPQNFSHNNVVGPTNFWECRLGPNRNFLKLTGQIFDLGLRNRNFWFLASPIWKNSHFPSKSMLF